MFNYKNLFEIDNAMLKYERKKLFEVKNDLILCVILTDEDRLKLI